MQEVADLDEDEFRALRAAVEDKQRMEAWTNLHEAVAASCEALWAILGRLDAGIPVVQIQKTTKPKDFGRFPRPSWVEPPPDEKELVVTSMADALRVMRGG